MRAVFVFLCLVGLLALTEAQVSPTQCKEGSKWFDGCNNCFCSNGVAACTLKACPDPAIRPRPGRAVGDDEAECEGEGRWRKQCNWCRCTNGKGSCTKKACPPFFDTLAPDTPECEGTVSWKKDCNDCHCANGKAVCTLKLCVTREDVQG